jgi:hypothetical protein
MAKTVIDVILGEAKAGDLEDMKAIASVIANRAAALGVSMEDVVSAVDAKGNKQFDAYGKAIPPGTGKYRDIAEQALNDVLTNGPVHNATFYATPAAKNNLPSGLKQETKTAGHVFFSDPQARSILTAQGYRMPNIQQAVVEQPVVPTPRPDIEMAGDFGLLSGLGTQLAPADFDTSRISNGGVQSIDLMGVSGDPLSNLGAAMGAYDNLASSPAQNWGGPNFNAQPNAFGTHLDYSWQQEPGALEAFQQRQADAWNRSNIPGATPANMGAMGYGVTPSAPPVAPNVFDPNSFDTARFDGMSRPELNTARAGFPVDYQQQMAQSVLDPVDIPGSLPQQSQIAFDASRLNQPAALDLTFMNIPNPAYVAEDRPASNPQDLALGTDMLTDALNEQAQQAAQQASPGLNMGNQEALNRQIDQVQQRQYTQPRAPLGPPIAPEQDNMMDPRSGLGRLGLLGAIIGGTISQFDRMAQTHTGKSLFDGLFSGGGNGFGFGEPQAVSGGTRSVSADGNWSTFSPTGSGRTNLSADGGPVPGLSTYDANGDGRFGGIFDGLFG